MATKDKILIWRFWSMATISLCQCWRRTILNIELLIRILCQYFNGFYASKARLTGIMFSTCPFVRPFFPLLSNLRTRYSEINLTNFDGIWHKWSTGQGHQTITFGHQEIKDQGHIRPKIDVEAWHRHHSQPPFFMVMCLHKHDEVRQFGTVGAEFIAG